MDTPSISVAHGFDTYAFHKAVVAAIPRYGDQWKIPNVHQIARALIACGIKELGPANQAAAIQALVARDRRKQAESAPDAIEQAEMIGFEIGLSVMAESADTVRRMVLRALELRDNPAKLRGYGKGIDRNVKSILRAVELYGEWFLPAKNASTVEMLIAIKIASTKDDAQRDEIYRTWRSNAALTYRDVEDMVKVANRKNKPNQRAPLAERIARHIASHDMHNAYELICAEPEIDGALKRCVNGSA